MSGRGPRLSYANVTATLALVIALGGSAYAAATITGADVKDDSLTGADVRGHAATASAPEEDGSLTTYDIRNGTIGAVDLANESVGSSEIVNNTITQSDLATDSVGSGKVIDDSLKGADIDESSLGKVADADKLDGKDSSAFVLGGGHDFSFEKVLQAASGGQSSDAEASDGAPGFFDVGTECFNGAFGVTGALMRMTNLSGDAMLLWRDDFLVPPVAVSTVGTGINSVENPAGTPPYKTAPNRVIWQVVASGGRRATVTGFQRFEAGDPAQCVFEVHVVSNQ
jgi:hypothetical protein